MNKIRKLKPNAICPTCSSKVYSFEVIDPLKNIDKNKFQQRPFGIINCTKI